MKLALIKIFVKAMDEESEGFACLRPKFPKISEAKMKERILVGPQIKQLFEVNDCSTKLNATERRAWEAFGNVCRNFLCNEHYSDVVHELLITQ